MIKNDNILFVVLTCDEYIKDRVSTIKKTFILAVGYLNTNIMTCIKSLNPH